MAGGKKQQNNRRDSIKNSRFHACPPAARQFTTSVNLVWRLVPFRVVYGQPLHNPVREGLPTIRPEFGGANGRSKVVAVVSGEVSAVRHSASMLCPAQRKASDRRRLSSAPVR